MPTITELHRRVREAREDLAVLAQEVEPRWVTPPEDAEEAAPGVEDHGLLRRSERSRDAYLRARVGTSLLDPQRGGLGTTQQVTMSCDPWDGPRPPSRGLFASAALLPGEWLNAMRPRPWGKSRGLTEGR
jgi:hypothetical protein